MSKNFTRLEYTTLLLECIHAYESTVSYQAKYASYQSKKSRLNNKLRRLQVLEKIAIKIHQKQFDKTYESPI